MINILYLHAGAELYGADKVLLNLLQKLDKNKYHPLIILPCDGVLADELSKSNIETAIIPYPILRRKYFNVKGILNYIASYFKYSKQIMKYIDKKNISEMHINTSAVLVGIYIKKKLNIPIIWHVHEIIVKPILLKRFINYLILKYADRIIVVSNAVKNCLAKGKSPKNNKIQVVYNGVDNQIYKPDTDNEYLYKEFNIPREAKIVGMIGRINSWKGQEDFIKAVGPVLKKNPDVYAMLVGGVFEGEEWRKDRLYEIISDMEYKDRIIISDYRSDSVNIHNLYDVFVLPSINPDPLPTVVLEAMACGKPIVGYRHGGICEMVEENFNGYLAEPHNTDELSEKIQRLIENDTVKKQFGENSILRQVNFFSMKNYINSFEKIYSELSQNRSKHTFQWRYLWMK